MVDQQNGKTLKKKERTEDQDLVVQGQPRQKKKRKLVGVLREKFYPTDNRNASLLEDLKNVDAADLSAREKVFSEHRDAIQILFNQSVNILSCVPGFFDDYTHCRHHFEHLAGMSLVQNVVDELDTQMGFVKKVLNVWCRTEVSKNRLEAGIMKSVEFHGSKIPEYVALLRELNQVWHKNLGGLFRVPAEKESNSPHILCREVSGAMYFDIHVEQTKVLKDLTLANAIASFFHIVFIGQLKYPDEGDAVATFLQRRVAKVDEKGMTVHEKICIRKTSLSV
jgi:hypothetical protein